MVTKTLLLNEELELKITKERQQTTFWLVDKLLNSTKRLADHQAGRWNFPTVIEKKEFSKLLHQYPAKFYTALVRTPEDTSQSYEQQFKCFRRRVNIKVTRFYNQITKG